MEWNDRRELKLQEQLQRTGYRSPQRRDGTGSRNSSQGNRRSFGSPSAIRRNPSPKPILRPSRKEFSTNQEPNLHRSFADSRSHKSQASTVKPEITKLENLRSITTLSTKRTIRNEVDETIQLFSELEGIFGKPTSMSTKNIDGNKLGRETHEIRNGSSSVKGKKRIPFASERKKEGSVVRNDSQSKFKSEQSCDQPSSTNLNEMELKYKQLLEEADRLSRKLNNIKTTNHDLEGEIENLRKIKPLRLR
eukprot:TRINITY_DN11095_c0_g1_i2.p1 TRINITY_DN11095_c0_g1~~TRINITY_DN11095_c0_g1_i2.p1  ORF type:complete len:249 (-),score=28.57 TRINITY_DN11095_c0_g1_i2:394-1140(-)